MTRPAGQHRPAVVPRRVHNRLPQLPITAVCVALVIGLVTVRLHHFRLGSAIISCSMLGAAGLRLVLPARRAGLLVVRSRALDVTFLVVVAVAVAGLASVVPSG